jgi:streptogramin lyase
MKRRIATFGEGPDRGAGSAPRCRWVTTWAAGLAVPALLAAPERAAACALTTTGAASVNAGATFTLTLGATDTGDGLPASWIVSWGDGTVQTFNVPADVPAAGGPVTHIYTARGWPSYFTYNILASAVCNGKRYFQNDLVVPSAVTDELNWYRHNAATNLAVTRAPVQSGPNAGLDYPLEAIVGPDGNVYVSGLSSGNVLRYNPTTGAFLDQFAAGGTAASGMAFGPDGHLYVGDATLRTVRRYHGTTGAFIDDFVTVGLGGIIEPEGLTFGPDGHLYVGDYTNDAVYKYNGSNGAFIGIFTTGTAPRDPEDFVFGPDGNLYVASDRDHKVLRYNGTTGAYMGDFVTANSGGLDNAQGVGFGPDGNFYVSSWKDDAVFRYNGTSGAFIDVYVSTGLGGIDTAEYFDFIPGHRVKVVAPQFAFLKPITIDRSKIPGTCGATLQNYPMLFNTTDPDLALTTSGGNVTDLQGDDIIFRAHDDTTCGGAGRAPCVLDHEIERYVGTTGQLVAWVRIPSVRTAAAGSDTVIYIYYGNAAVTSPTENPAGVWDATYKGVWHLTEDVIDEATSGTHEDSTSNGNAGAQNGNVEGTGKIADGQDFDGTNDYVAIGNVIGAASAVTLSAWIQHDNVAAIRNRYIELGNEVVIRHDGVNSVGQLHFYVSTGGIARALRVNGVLANGIWYHVAGTWDGTTQRVFLNGVEMASQLPGGSLDPIAAYGNISASGSEVMDGLIDEARVSNIARPACSIAASYNNEVWPDKAVTPSPNPSPNPSSGFYTVGAATAVELISFTATGADGVVELAWETGSEMDNLGFHVYRSSAAAGPYEQITSSLVPGLGSSPVGARYRYRDRGLVNGATYYYELEDIESRGRTERHGPVSATPVAGGATGAPVEPADEERSSSFITYGRPEANRLRVVTRSRDRVVLELITTGFMATPERDGTVRLEIPDYQEIDDAGLPVKRAWVEALAGRHVDVESVREHDIVTIGWQPAELGGHEIVAYGDGVVDLRRRARGHPKRASSKEAARVVSVAFQGAVKKALVELAPLSWDPSRERIRLAKKLVVTLSFARPDAAELVGADGRRGRRSRGKDKEVTGGGVVARFATTAPGLYAVGYDELFGRRYRRGIDPSRLKLSRLGETVAYHLEPATSRFAPGSTLYFVSAGADANPYGKEAVFELEYGVSGGLRMAVREASPSGAATGSYLRRDGHEENRLYQAALMEAEDRWMWDVLFAPARKGYAFSLDALAAAAEPARLELKLQGGSDFPASPDHHVAVYVNGTLVGERSWDGKIPQMLDIELEPGVLRDGENLLEIENVGDTGAAYSMVFLDRFVVTYTRLATAESGVLEGTWTASGTAEVSGVSSRASLLDTTSSRPVWLAGAVSWGDGVLRWRAEAEHRYLVVDADRVARPEIRRATAGRVKRDSSQADYIVLGPQAYLDAAGPLLDHRRRQGLTARAVSTEEIFSEFGFGESRPEAIRDFLAHTYHRWKAPSPRYVLLLGDATYDFKDYSGTGVENRVPPLMLETQFLWTVSDPTYAAVNGEDLLPDLAIGRLPASSVDEVRALVEKRLFA